MDWVTGVARMAQTPHQQLVEQNRGLRQRIAKQYQTLAEKDRLLAERDRRTAELEATVAVEAGKTAGVGYAASPWPLAGLRSPAASRIRGWNGAAPRRATRPRPAWCVRGESVGPHVAERPIPTLSVRLQASKTALRLRPQDRP